MVDSAFYLVTREIAMRSGVIEGRYRTQDGRFILDNKDLSRIRFTTDEYISGLQGVEKIDEMQAKTLIAQNGYKMGFEGETNDEPEPENVPEVIVSEGEQENADEQEENNDEQTQESDEQESEVESETETENEKEEEE